MTASELAKIDERLLAAVAGQELRISDWLSARQKGLDLFLGGDPSAADLQVLQQRTRRLEEKFLHWRRSAIMELSAIERHLRYLSEQASSDGKQAPTRVDISG